MRLVSGVVFDQAPCDAHRRGRYRGLPDALPERAFQAMKLLLALEPGGHGAALISPRAQLRRIDASLLRY